MRQTLDAIFDGEVFRPDGPIQLERSSRPGFRKIVATKRHKKRKSDADFLCDSCVPLSVR